MLIDDLAVPSPHFMLNFYYHTIAIIIDIATATATITVTVTAVDITLAIAITTATTYNLVAVIANAYLKIV